MFRLPCHPSVLKRVLEWEAGAGPWRSHLLCGVLDPLGTDLHLLEHPHFFQASPHESMFALLSAILILQLCFGGCGRWKLEPMCGSYNPVTRAVAERTACVLCDSSVLTTPTYSRWGQDYLSNILGQVDPASGSYWPT